MTGEARVKTQLEKLRTIAEVRLRSGTVPDWSWPQHVQLIEAVDAMLHDISVAESARYAKRYTGGPLRPGQRQSCKAGYPSHERLPSLESHAATFHDVTPGR